MPTSSTSPTSRFFPLNQDPPSSELSAELAKSVLGRLAASKSHEELRANLVRELTSKEVVGRLRIAAEARLRVRKLKVLSPMRQLAIKLGLAKAPALTTAEVKAEMVALARGALNAVSLDKSGKPQNKELMAKAFANIGMGAALAKGVESIADKLGKSLALDKAAGKAKPLGPKKAVNKDLGTKSIHVTTAKAVADKALETAKRNGLFRFNVKRDTNVKAETPFTITLVSFVDGKETGRAVLGASTQKELLKLADAVVQKVQKGNSLQSSAKEAEAEVASKTVKPSIGMSRDNCM